MTNYTKYIIVGSGQMMFNGNICEKTYLIPTVQNNNIEN